MKVNARIMVLGLLLPAVCLSADHIDSPTAIDDPAADLADTYAFVNPNDPNEAILIATFDPFATRATLFSDAVEYNFFIDSDAGDMRQITCSFSANQIVTCNGPGGREVSGPTGEILTDGDFRVFAGLVEDPFYVDLPRLRETLSTGEVAFIDPGEDFLAGVNIHALVIGINRNALGSDPGVTHTVWANTVRVKGAGVGSGVTGSWIDPENPGQGWIIEVVSNPAADDGDSKNTAVEQFVMYHFAYQDGGQMWLVGNGPDIEGNMATVEVLRTAGGQFGEDFVGDSVTTESVGTMKFTFEDCRTATVMFDSSVEDLADYEIDIQRLTDVTDLKCVLFKSGQIDREGRPAVNSALIPSGTKDDYNFASDPATWAEMFTDEITNSLVFTDGLDGVPGNLLTGDAATLASVLVDDRLVIRFDIPECGGYLAVEAAGLAGIEPTECGGRTLAADVVDVTLTAVVSGFETPVGDNVDSNDAEFLDEFPFVAPPHL